MLVCLLWVGNFGLDLKSHKYCVIIYSSSFHYIALSCMVDGLRMDGLVRAVGACG